MPSPNGPPIGVSSESDLKSLAELVFGVVDLDLKPGNRFFSCVPASGRCWCCQPALRAHGNNSACRGLLINCPRSPRFLPLDARQRTGRYGGYRPRGVDREAASRLAKGRSVVRGGAPAIFLMRNGGGNVGISAGRQSPGCHPEAQSQDQGDSKQKHRHELAHACVAHILAQPGANKHDGSIRTTQTS